MGSHNYYTLDSIWENVIVTDGCWQWTGNVLANGYGLFSRQSHARSAHRWFYQLLVGPVPDGLVLDHLCRNRSCVNPAHLEPVTCKENVLRGIGPSARNAAKTRCSRGHEYTLATTRIKADGDRDCKVCAKALARIRDQRPEAKERHRREASRWRAANLAQARERQNKRNRQLRLENPELVSAQKHARYLADREHNLAYAKAYRESKAAFAEATGERKL